MTKETDFLEMLKEAFRDQAIDVTIVTDTDAEVYIDDWVFRVNVVADIVS